jgi:beta-lactamase class A
MKRLPDGAAITRRVFLGAVGGAVLGCAGASLRSTPFSPGPALAELEARAGGRVGFFALASDSGKTLAHRADERFALCSTFKWLLAAAVLAKMDDQSISLEQEITFGPADIIDYSPVTSQHVGQGRMTVAELARATVVTSDNTAGNLLLTLVGGPSGLTTFLRAHGDGITRLDRNEPALNSNLPGDSRDTTSPRAMVSTMRTLLTANALSSAHRELLLDWMISCETGKQRIRSGLPRDWRVGDKTGTGSRGAVNDVAIAWPPGRAPILMAAYLSDSGSPVSSLNSIHVELGRLVAQIL